MVLLVVVSRVRAALARWSCDVNSSVFNALVVVQAGVALGFVLVVESRLLTTTTTTIAAVRSMSTSASN